MLKGYPSVDRWAVSVATAGVAGKLKKFQHQLLAEVRSHFARRIGFFELDVDGPGLKQKIEEWFLHSAPRRKPQPQQDAPSPRDTLSGAPVPPSPEEMPYDSWLRWAFVCLLSKSSAERRMEGALTLIELWAGSGKKNSKESQLESEWYRFIASRPGETVRTVPRGCNSALVTLSQFLDARMAQRKKDLRAHFQRSLQSAASRRQWIDFLERPATRRKASPLKQPVGPPPGA
jgi:hypothetical protein